jgi:hypothetical protein
MEWIPAQGHGCPVRRRAQQIFVTTGLVPAAHRFKRLKTPLRARREYLTKPVIMGHQDKPGGDGRWAATYVQRSKMFRKRHEFHRVMSFGQASTGQQWRKAGMTTLFEKFGRPP